MEGQDSAALRLFMWAVTAVAAPLVALTRSWQALLPGDLDAHLVAVVVLFSLVLVAGELWPIPVARGEEGGDEITVSSTFGFALLLVVPVFWTVLAQTVALAIDWKLHGRQWHRLPFNVGQYAIAFTAARATYALAAGEPFTALASGPPVLFAAVLAGAAFLLLNNGLVAVAVASHLRVPVWKVLAEDVTWQLMTSAPLLGLGPLAAQAAEWTPASVVLLLIPIVALHRSGHTAMRREQEALRDPLTGLANRTLLSSAAERALQSATGTTAMLLIDLDHFKDVNDTLGHAVGDELLIAVAQRLQAQAGPGDLVARLGGDEFVVLSRRCDGPHAAEDLARRLQAAISEPYRVQGVVLTVGCSVGIGLAPEHVEDVEGLLRCADVALYAAKDTRGTHALYDRHTDQHSAALLGLQADLRAALEDVDDEQISRRLPAPARPAHRSRQRRRVPGPVAPPRARQPAARQLHPDGREHLAHRPAHASRARPGARAARRLVARRPGPVARGEPLGPPAQRPHAARRPCSTSCRATTSRPTGCCSRSPRAG